MARKLKTGWVCLATSGSVVDGDTDGRVVKKEWLEQMAETFNTSLYTPKLWPEHRRYSSAGTVLALKVEPAKQPALDGELQLFGILSPNDWLVRANREGDYTFPSIEVGENFRGTGKFFLRGLGVTDDPGSVGVSELEFSSKDGKETALSFNGNQLSLHSELEQEETGLFKRVFNRFGDNPEQPPETEKNEMTPEQLEALKDHTETVIKQQFAAMPIEEKENKDGDELDKVCPKAFSSLKAENETLKVEFGELKEKFSALENEEAGGQELPEGDVPEAFVI